MKNLNKLLIVTMKSVISIALVTVCTLLTTIAVTSTLTEYGKNIETNTKINPAFKSHDV